MTFFNPPLGGHQQPLKGSRIHYPKKVTFRRIARCIPCFLLCGKTWTGSFRLVQRALRVGCGTAWPPSLRSVGYIARPTSWSMPDPSRGTWTVPGGHGHIRLPRRSVISQVYSAENLNGASDMLLRLRSKPAGSSVPHLIIDMVTKHNSLSQEFDRHLCAQKDHFLGKFEPRPMETPILEIKSLVTWDRNYLGRLYRHISPCKVKQRP